MTRSRSGLGKGQVKGKVRSRLDLSKVRSRSNLGQGQCQVKIMSRSGQGYFRS